MRRRQFLHLSGFATGALYTQGIEARKDISSSGYQSEVREYLGHLIRTRQEVQEWLNGSAFPFDRYDGELGYLHRDRRFKEGMKDSICTYTYDKSAARHTVMYADKHCRINSYGNSFTSCEQVSDGESFQEVLAAFLGEPVRNWGIGGYSVYQAYLRMKREEKLYPAQYIIFNIFEDDHYRNLLSWLEIRYGKNWKSFHAPSPYVIANPATGQFVEMPNPCPTADSLYNLCDPDWVYKSFKNDFVLKLRLAQEAGKHPHPDPAIVQMVQELASQQGIDTQMNHSREDLIKTTHAIYTRAGLYATMRIVGRIEEFAKLNNKKILYVLSYGGPTTVAKRFLGEKRFDQNFVDFMEARKLPYVDLLEAHAADYEHFKPDIKYYLGRYYVDGDGHYNPAGNFFCAFAMLNKLVAMLDPKPTPYSGFYDCSSGRCKA